MSGMLAVSLMVLMVHEHFGCWVLGQHEEAGMLFSRC